MESFKKFLPFFLVAVVFAAGGYFVGVGGMSNQEAAFYKSAPVAQTLGNVTRDPIGGCIGGRGVTGDPCSMMVPSSGSGATGQASLVTGPNQPNAITEALCATIASATHSDWAYTDRCFIFGAFRTATSSVPLEAITKTQCVSFGGTWYGPNEKKGVCELAIKPQASVTAIK